jgi:hypothetical protein
MSIPTATSVGLARIVRSMESRNGEKCGESTDVGHGIEAKSTKDVVGRGASTLENCQSLAGSSTRGVLSACLALVEVSQALTATNWGAVGLA